MHSKNFHVNNGKTTCSKKKKINIHNKTTQNQNGEGGERGEEKKRAKLRPKAESTRASISSDYLRYQLDVDDEGETSNTRNVENRRGYQHQRANAMRMTKIHDRVAGSNLSYSDDMTNNPNFKIMVTRTHGSAESSSNEENSHGDEGDNEEEEMEEENEDYNEEEEEEEMEEEEEEEEEEMEREEEEIEVEEEIEMEEEER
ncbi:hypothetical protein RFI_08483 [Reticulomyxa filosa]|uniref:Uncharacterized protein n=1 Tax=Reticulomyxa filosa TaxID=46433 RepID=X6NTM1_RETFI|nr:hypothetical protein RFI_08483 [Reticulomyxa filosa]|eukprot:ETO28647.1 hypothetical protein RFI_08483 [Reticulomyxa filosa]